MIVGLRGTQADLYCLLKSDFTGSNNFLYWLGAVLLIGMIGYIPKLRPVSDAFIVLMIVALFLASKGGLFANLSTAFGQTSATPAPTTTTTGDVSIGTVTIGDPLTNALPPLSSYLK